MLQALELRFLCSLGRSHTRAGGCLKEPVRLWETCGKRALLPGWSSLSLKDCTPQKSDPALQCLRGAAAPGMDSHCRKLQGAAVHEMEPCWRSSRRTASHRRDPTVQQGNDSSPSAARGAPSDELTATPTPCLLALLG